MLQLWDSHNLQFIFYNAFSFFKTERLDLGYGYVSKTHICVIMFGKGHSVDRRDSFHNSLEFIYILSQALE